MELLPRQTDTAEYYRLYPSAVADGKKAVMKGLSLRHSLSLSSYLTASWSGFSRFLFYNLLKVLISYHATGIDNYKDNINDILRVPFDYCKPSVRVVTETVECVDKNGNPNHLLIITIPQSSELQANQQNDTYYRMGDKSKKLNFDERLQLLYAKESLSR